MRPQLPEPLRLPWELKENLTAKSGVDELPDGRTKYWVDEILKGITPEMFVWWFSGGLIGDMDIDGRLVSRYRIWHPYDHVHARVLVNRPAEAREGALAELEEYFGRNPEYYTNPAVRVDQIDEQAVATTWFENGIAIGHLDHELEAVPGGMRLVHVMYVPGESTELGKLLAPRVWPPRDGTSVDQARHPGNGQLREFPCRSSTSARPTGEKPQPTTRPGVRQIAPPRIASQSLCGSTRGRPILPWLVHQNMMPNANVDD